jgi:hypothetical protein
VVDAAMLDAAVLLWLLLVPVSANTSTIRTTIMNAATAAPATRRRRCDR